MNSQDLNNLFKNDELTTNSIKIYTSNILKIVSDYKLNLTNNTFDNFEIIEKIKNNDDIKDNTKKNKLTSIMIFLKALKKNEEIIKQYKNAIDEINLRIIKLNKKMEKSPEEIKNWVSIDEINKKINEYKNIIEENKKMNLNTYHELKEYQKYIILLIHSKYPMRNDLADLEIYTYTNYTNAKTDNKNNYLVVSRNNGILILNIYKTFKTYGQLKYKLDDVLLKEINKYYVYLHEYKKRQNINNNWFIIDKKGDKLDRNDYTKLFNTLYENKKLSTTLMRKIIISDVWDINKIEDVAHKAQHSKHVALNNYVKK